MRPRLPASFRDGSCAVALALLAFTAPAVAADRPAVGDARLVDEDGRVASLPLAERRRAPLRVVVDGRERPAPRLRVLAGSADGAGTASTVVSIRPDGSVRGVLLEEGRSLPLTGRIGADGVPVLRVSPRGVPHDRFAGDAPCGAADAAPAPHPATPSGGGTPPRRRMARVAIDCDTAYRHLFASDADAIAYAQELVAATSLVYERDLGIELRLDLVRLWPEGGEPFDAADLGGFRQWWNEFDDPSSFEVVHLLSGRRDLPYGGVAYLASACNGNAFSIAGFLLGDSAGDVQAPSLESWDLVVSAHEIGHNLGTPHTHSYDPPIDHCASGEPVRGTIMSYCHVNAGGLLNTDLRFHARVQDFIRANNPVGDCLPFDCDGSGVDDATEIAFGALADANANGIPDACEDCDGNGVLDPVDLAGGAPDVDGNGQPDWCQDDCDADGVPDAYAIALGSVADENGDRIPDACQPDCDDDGTADHVQIRSAGAPDVDRDSRPDGCQDCLGAGVPDWFGAGLGGAVAVADPAFGVRIYHPRSGVQVATPADPDALVVGRDVADLLFLPDGRLLASVPSGPWLAVLDGDLLGWTMLVAGTAAGGAPTGLVHRDDGLVLVAGEGGGVALLDPDAAAFVGTLVAADPARAALRALVLRPVPGDLLAIDAASGAWRFDAATGRSIGGLPGSDALLADARDAAPLANGDVVVTCRADGVVRRIAPDGSITTFNDEYDLVAPWGAAVDVEGHVLVATDLDAGVRVAHYDPAAGRYIRSFVRGDAELADPRAIAVRPFGDEDLDADGLPDACACPADLDDDGSVGFADLLLVLSDWGTAAPTPLDLDHSGAVDFGDVLAVLAAWGPCAE